MGFNGKGKLKYIQYLKRQQRGFTPFLILVTVSVFCLIHLKVWKFFPEPDGKKPSPPEILVKYASDYSLIGKKALEHDCMCFC